MRQAHARGEGPVGVPAVILPADEAQRMVAVHRYDILDTPPDGAFDRITHLAAQMLKVPVAIVSVVDHDRIWFKSHHGLPDVVQIDREPGLCASAILHSTPWLVTDAAVDARTLANPLVAGDFGLRFYAGVPLRTSDGYNLGTLCVLDTKPRSITPDEVAILENLAGVVMDELELRLASLRTVAVEQQLRRDAEALAGVLQASLLPPRPPIIAGTDVASRYLPGERHLQIGGDFLDVFHAGPDTWGIVIGDACGKGASAAALAALARWTVRASAAQQSQPRNVLNDTNGVLRSESDGDSHFCTMVFARLQMTAGRTSMTLACGGHPRPVVVRASGYLEERGHPGMPVGMFADTGATDDTVELSAGDAVVFYTDGITEARNRSGDQFGAARLHDLLLATAGQTADAAATAVLDATRAFSNGGPADDIAILVLRVTADP